MHFCPIVMLILSNYQQCPVPLTHAFTSARPFNVYFIICYSSKHDVLERSQYIKFSKGIAKGFVIFRVWKKGRGCLSKPSGKTARHSRSMFSKHCHLDRESETNLTPGATTIYLDISPDYYESLQSGLDSKTSNSRHSFYNS